MGLMLKVTALKFIVVWQKKLSHWLGLAWSIEAIALLFHFKLY